MDDREEVGQSLARAGLGSSWKGSVSLLEPPEFTGRTKNVLSAKRQW
jgi:hypothetical protein